MQKYYPRFMNLDLMLFILEIIYQIKKDVTYIINFNEYSDIKTHWIALYALNNNATYFDIFGVEHIPKNIKIFIDKSIVCSKYF